ncbi:hypothetical protein [Mongoliitalea lutea]|uniref:Uncharacterized protein n=1 Tax=Mongoliitalea lutea TaxID=849756 RepID=A0A8J3CU59_9BACT|nr:hypothetical protein [Mongoliitalea lutea]GHB25654.1 hypothetical protein GCM10008106_03040 [Mongoliitalea lutea]
MKNLLLLLVLWLSLTMRALEFLVRSSQEKIEIHSKDGNYEELLAVLASHKLSLGLNASLVEKSSPKDLLTTLVYSVSENGKTIYQSDRNSIQLTAKMKTIELFPNGLEESMISTWEKQGFIRRQVGRIENPDKSTGNLPKPQGPGAGKTNPNDDKNQGELGKPNTKIEQQGFIRRQVGRIPKSSYEVKVTVHSPKDKGQSHPSTFLIIII